MNDVSVSGGDGSTNQPRMHLTISEKAIRPIMYAVADPEMKGQSRVFVE